jgi:DNA-binding SARP family transcriptional activator
LLLRPQATRREQVIGALWPDVPPPQARHHLSDCLYQLRRALPEAAIFADREHVRFDPAARWLDAAAHAEALTNVLVHELQLSAVEVAAFWSFVKKRQRAAHR